MLHWAFFFFFCGVFCPTERSRTCWSSVSRLCPLGEEAVQWDVAEVVRVFRRNGTRERVSPRRGCCRVPCATHLAFRGVHSTSLLCARRGSRRPSLSTRARANARHGGWHERSRGFIFKALALSGNSWLGRHGGSWLLALSSSFLPFVV